MNILKILVVGNAPEKNTCVAIIEELGHIAIEADAINPPSPKDINCIFRLNNGFSIEVEITGNPDWKIIIENNNLYLQSLENKYLAAKTQTADELIKDTIVTLSRMNDENILSEIFFPLATENKCDVQGSLSHVQFYSGKFSSPNNIITMFESRVMKQPDDIAIRFNDENYSYLQVHLLSNSIALHLQENMGSNKQNLIGVFFDRSVNSILSILAILKVGAAYVPIDVNSPEDRLKYIIDDSCLDLILTDSVTLSRNLFISRIPNTINVDLINFDRHQANLSSVELSGNALAYVMYTSGTTGRPKGVMIEHAGVTNYITHQNYYLGSPNNKNFYFIHSIAFDTSISSIFGALLFGNTIVFTETTDILNEHNFKKFAINIAYLPPAYLNTIDPVSLDNLDTIVISGEVSDPDTICALKPLIINEYGPTEGSVCSSYKFVDKANIDVRNIGKAIYNKLIFILDENGNEVPLGQIGEICIGGIGLARGYLNLADQTDNKFQMLSNLQNQLPSISTRIYKTGDMGKILPNGDIYYCGRIDTQIKIRGFRIELEEIAQCAKQVPGVKNCTIIPDYRGESPLLLLFYTEVFPVDNLKLQGHIKQSLPEYMHPLSYILIDSFPMTINNKIDNAALFAKYLDQPASRVSHENFSENHVQSFLYSLWLRLLPNTKDIKPDDNFFDLGGHSLLATKIISEVRKRYKINLKPHDIYELGTLKKLSLRIEELKSNLLSESAGNLSNSVSSMCNFNEFVDDYDHSIKGVFSPVVMQLSNQIKFRYYQSSPSLALPILVIVPNIGIPVSVYEPVAEYFKDEVRVITWNHRLWKADLCNYASSMEDHLVDLDAILGHIKTKNCTIAAWCAGAKISIAAAIKHPYVISNLILISGGFGDAHSSNASDSQEKAAMFSMLEDIVINPNNAEFYYNFMNNDFSKNLEAPMFSNFFGTNHERDLLKNIVSYPFHKSVHLLKAYAELSISMKCEDITKALPSILQDTYIFTATNDYFGECKDTYRAISDKIKNSHMIILKDSDHYAIFHDKQLFAMMHKIIFNKHILPTEHQHVKTS